MLRAAAGATAGKADIDLALSKALAIDVGFAMLVLFVGSAVLMLGDIWAPDALRNWVDWGGAIGVAVASALVFQLVRLSAILDNHAVRRPDKTADFVELFLYFVATHTLLGAIVFLSTMPGVFGLNEVSLSHTDEVPPNEIHVWILVTIFALTFLPLLVGFLCVAAQDARSRGQTLLRDDVVSLPSLIVMVGVLSAVGLLAWAAASRLFTMTNDFGVFVTVAVIFAFIATIAAPNISRYWNERSEERLAHLEGVHLASIVIPMRPEIWVSKFDSILVRLVAPFSGATQKRYPHLLLLAVMLPLSALGFVLASPYGLVPIAVGTLIVLSLGRRWAWLEEDRETASRLQSTSSRDIHIGFENDLKDEALLGYAWLFILVPLALNQVQEWVQPFDPVDGAGTGNAFVDWVRFFGAELAKAVPFVDWWEIYSVDVATPFDASASGPLAKHLTFVSRALVDLVIMAALFQALGIWQRSRTQQRLYDAGQLDHFDPFTEASFFETGMYRTPDGLKPKKRFQKRVGAHVEIRRSLGRAPLPYSSQRLAEMLTSDNEDVRHGAKWMVDSFGVLTGTPEEQLRQLRNRWLLFRLPQLVLDSSALAREAIRNEKLEFERVLAALEASGSLLEEAEIGALYALLEVVRGSPEFGYAREIAYSLLGKAKSELAVGLLAMCVLENRHHQARPYWRDRIQAVTGIAPSLYEGRADARERAFSSLEVLGKRAEASLRQRKLALELLEWLATPYVQDDGNTGDRANSARIFAKDAAANVRASLGISDDGENGS